MDLAGRTVMVTGASGGIGAPLCAALVAAGAQVLAVGRDEARLQHVAQALPTGRVTCVAADVSTPAGRERLLQAARAAQPTPSVLVLAHAQAAFGLFDEQSPDAMAQLMHTNLVAPMLILHGMLPVLLAHASASVVVVGSTFGSLAFPGFAAYSASKFGLRGLTEALAREYADTPLRFQYLSPRATRTPFNTAAVDALNAELKVASDAPGEVARQLVAAIAQGTSRLQVGWPEKLFARLNGLAPGLVDRNLRASLPIVRRHARRPRPSTAENPRHEVPSLR
ncbi:MAG: short chain dehydrogenase [Stenotrophomonas acidaminiphila]|nr:MAG: short chain dehydrogenase [Stenotrophomonas acidaminiphila]